MGTKEERNITISKSVSTSGGYISFSICEEMTKEKENLITEIVSNFIDEVLKVFNS